MKISISTVILSVASTMLFTSSSITTVKAYDMVATDVDVSFEVGKDAKKTTTPEEELFLDHCIMRAFDDTHPDADYKPEVIKIKDEGYIEEEDDGGDRKLRGPSRTNSDNVHTRMLHGRDLYGYKYKWVCTYPGGYCMYNFYKLSIFFGCKYCLCEDDDSIINRCRRARDLAEEVEDITWGEALCSCLALRPLQECYRC